MERKKRNEEGMQDPWWLRRAWWLNSPWSLLPRLQLLLQGSFDQEEVKQLHCRDTQRPNIMNYLHLETLPCLLKQRVSGWDQCRGTDHKREREGSPLQCM